MPIVKKGLNKYPPEMMAEAIKRIQAGENPFRVAKDMAVPRTTILYWMEKSKLEAVDSLPAQRKPQELVATPNFDPAEIIKKNIYVTYWRACLKHLTIVNAKPKSEDAERSSRILKNLEFRVSAVWAPKAGQGVVSIPCAEEDKITFREFVIERKQSNVSENKVVDGGLAAPSPDTPTQPEGPAKPAEQQGAEGA